VTGNLIPIKNGNSVPVTTFNLLFNKGLDYFTLRGKRKVNAQWLLFCVVHNLGKIHQVGLATG